MFKYKRSSKSLEKASTLKRNATMRVLKLHLLESHWFRKTLRR